MKIRMSSIFTIVAAVAGIAAEIWCYKEMSLDQEELEQTIDERIKISKEQDA